MRQGLVPRFARQLELDPFADEFLADPFRYHSTLREAGPVVYLTAYDIFGMARYGEVHAALMNASVFCSGRGVGLSDFANEEPWRPPSLLLEADPPIHDGPRRIMNKTVALSTLRELRPQWARIAADLVDRLAQKGQFDAVTELAEVFPLRISHDGSLSRLVDIVLKTLQIWSGGCAAASQVTLFSGGCIARPVE